MLRKLRVGLVAGAVLLLAVVVGFVWYGRMVGRRLRFDLPKRLGVDITQETNNFTYSQSLKGRTIFTVRAAKEVQHANGLITLHDVGIVLYGRGDGRDDRISGQEFEFDPKLGVMKAAGAVYLDLPAPGAKAGIRVAARTVHVKTSGLVFDQKAQTATTDEYLEFSAGGLTGSAVGAEYDSGAGRVELRSAVRVDGVQGKRAVALTAGRAELRRKENVVLLDGATYRTARGKAAADHAVVHLAAVGAAEGAAEGSGPERIEGQGHVVLSGDGRGTMTGDRVDLALGSGGKLREGHLWGGVRYELKEGMKSADGQARDLRALFDGQGNPDHAVVVGGVRFDQRVPRGAKALQAERVELALGQMAGGAREGGGKIGLKEAEATGGALFRMVGENAKGRSSSEVSGDELKARFVEAGGKNEISALDGTGHTVVHQVGVNGTDQTSRGETLAVSFKASSKAGKVSGKGGSDALGAGAVEIDRAVQRGGVTVERVIPAKAARVAASGAGSGSHGSGPETERAAGDEAVYEADGDRLTMRGGVQVRSATSELMAEKVVMDRESGDATAEGKVRVSYLAEDGKGEPLHIVGERAVEKKAAGTAEFFGGGAGNDARMWQGGSEVEAAVLSFFQDGKDKESRRLVGHGARAGDVVRAVLASAGPGSGAKARATERGGAAAAGEHPTLAGPEGRGGGAVRIQGEMMTYLEGPRTVEFIGHVTVEDAQGRMNAERAIATLAEKRAAPGSAVQTPGSAVQTPGSAVQTQGAEALGGDLMAGRVERLVARGAVEIEQPGRRGSGEQLVYSAADRTFVLTGTKAAPPRVEDEARGTTTGASLRFRSGDQSVEVAGDGTAQGKVRSEMRVKQ